MSAQFFLTSALQAFLTARAFTSASWQAKEKSLKRVLMHAARPSPCLDPAQCASTSEMQAAMVPCCASTTEDVTAIVRKDTVTIVVRRKVVRAVMLKFLWARIAPRLIANSGGGFYLYQTPTNRLVDVRFGSKADICTAAAHVRFTPRKRILMGVIPRPLFEQYTYWESAAARGKITLTSVNLPGCVSTSIAPPCCLTMMS